jgi:hypothetical protein
MLPELNRLFGHNFASYQSNRQKSELTIVGPGPISLSLCLSSSPHPLPLYSRTTLYCLSQKDPSTTEKETASNHVDLNTRAPGRTNSQSKLSHPPAVRVILQIDKVFSDILEIPDTSVRRINRHFPHHDIDSPAHASLTIHVRKHERPTNAHSLDP